MVGIVFTSAALSPSAVCAPSDLAPSPLHPSCKAHDRLFKWVGVNTPPPSVIDDQWIRRLEAALLKASCHVGHEELWVRHQKVSQNQQCSDFTHGFPTVPGVEKFDRTLLLKFPKHRMTFQSQLAS